MAFTKSDKLKQVIFQEEIDGVLTDLMARTHVDNVIYEEGGKQIALSEKLASLIATVATKADSNNVTADIKTATDSLYNKIMGITAEDGAPVAEVVVYQHPSSHPASMITDTAEKVMMTAAERTKLSGVTAGASAIVSGTGAVADASAVPTLMIKVIEDTDNT